MKIKLNITVDPGSFPWFEYTTELTEVQIL